MSPFISSLAVVLFLALLLNGTAAELGSPNLEGGKSVSFRSLDGISFPTEAGELVYCNRVKFVGKSRWSNPHKFAHSLKIQIEQKDAAFSPKVDICLHRNASLGMCECSKANWKSLRQGPWSASRSPFETFYMDIRTIDSFSDTAFKVSTTEEFHYYHLVFFFTGLATLFFSELLSSWVPFYYSSAMSLGVLLVVIILLYQGMKLLPTGKKSTVSIVLYGSLLGFGTVLLQYLASLLSSALSQLGIGEDTLNPVTVFAPLAIVIFGAWLGYWGVRKLVLSENGLVDVGTAHFVKWALRLVGATLLLQSSRDDVFAIFIMFLGISACWGCSYLRLSALSKPFAGMREYFSKRRGKGHSEFFYKAWPQTKTHHSPQGASPAAVYSVSPKTPPAPTCGFDKGGDYVSSFHSTSARKPLSKDEYAEVSKSCTADAMRELFNSPDFSRWAVSQADRIMVAPVERRDERAESEIEKTALMEAAEPATTAAAAGTAASRRRLSKYI